jgi:hypothetical protein
MGITDFLEEKFRAVVEEGLKEIVHNRPEDPIRYLGEYLIAKSNKIQ